MRQTRSLTHPRQEPLGRRRSSHLLRWNLSYHWSIRMLGSPELEAMCGHTAAPSVDLSTQRADVHVTQPGSSVEIA